MPPNDEDADRTRLGQLVTPWTAEEAPDEYRHYLFVADGFEPGRRITVGTSPVVIGRADPADVVLPDSEISRRHCRVEARGAQLLVTDLASTNGTFVDGKRIERATRIANGGMLRIGRQLLRHEYRSRLEVETSEAMERDLRAARGYVESLLPAPLKDGAVRTEWLFEPSARIGGDALGYHAIDQDHFALYLLDVAGHGASAALHAASVINVMRKQALPGVDMRRPGEVMRGLNAMFPMEQHGDLFFTAWYGVYVKQDRELRHCAGGHHPGYLVGSGRTEAAPVGTRNPIIGVPPDHEYEAAGIAVPPGSKLYLFSDGVFEVQDTTGRQRQLDDFLPLLLAPADGKASEPERLVGEMRRLTGSKVFEDDLTVLVVTFP